MLLRHSSLCMGVAMMLCFNSLAVGVVLINSLAVVGVVVIGLTSLVLSRNFSLSSGALSVLEAMGNQACGVM